MQQRQLRLGDILDDYCPRERRVTNHAVVAMVGPDVKQTRCTTCDAEHEYKHARVPRQRRKQEAPAALYSQVLAGAPKVTHNHHDETDGQETPAQEPIEDKSGSHVEELAVRAEQAAAAQPALSEVEGSEVEGDDDEPDADAVAATSEGPASADGESEDEPADDEGDQEREEGPVHRPLIRASLPRPEGQAPPPRPVPEFTIRQPGGGRPNRFRPRHPRGGQPFHGNRSNGGNMAGPMRGGAPRQGGRPPIASRRPGPGRKRSK